MRMTACMSTGRSSDMSVCAGMSADTSSDRSTSHCACRHKPEYNFLWFTMQLSEPLQTHFSKQCQHLPHMWKSCSSSSEEDSRLTSGAAPSSLENSRAPLTDIPKYGQHDLNSNKRSSSFKDNLPRIPLCFSICVLQSSFSRISFFNCVARLLKRPDGELQENPLMQAFLNRFPAPADSSASNFSKPRPFPKDCTEPSMNQQYQNHEQTASAGWNVYKVPSFSSFNYSVEIITVSNLTV